jgi:type I restriction enzyme M protein
MLTDSRLRSKIDAIWDKLYAGGLSNPLDAVEQLSFLMFLKRLEEIEEDRERTAKLRKVKYEPIFKDKEIRWSYWSNLDAEKALKIAKEMVFTFIKELGGEGGSFADQMENAEFKIKRPSLLIEACRLIDELQISSQNQDVQGDLYEYLLSRLNISGENGQFRTPRHIIRMMVQMIDPKPGEKMCDPAAGTCGFPVNFYQYILEKNTDPKVLVYDEDGFPHRLVGDKLTKEQSEFLQKEAITAYDNDAGMTMLRIGSMNLILHGISSPNFKHTDTLSKVYKEERLYDIVLANPPFKGAIDSSDINPTLPTKCKTTQLLFLHLFLRLLENGGRAAVIVPDGVLFGSQLAHMEIRKKLIEENRLDGVVSMPAGIFRPYAGVSTAVLLFTKGASTEKVWFYDMEHDGFSLDDKRQKTSESDISDLIECWRNRFDKKFAQKRDRRLAELREKIAPLKKKRLGLLSEVNRLTYEQVIAGDGEEKAQTALDVDKKKLDELHQEIAPIQNEINQLTRQFWVAKDKLKASKYDLSASRYREVERDEVFYEKPDVTIKRLQQLEELAIKETTKLGKML